MIKSILVALDGSEHAESGTRVRALARRAAAGDG